MAPSSSKIAKKHQARCLWAENGLRVIPYLCLHLLRLKCPVHLTLRSRPFWLRPRTPDFRVIRSFLNGEYAPVVGETSIKHGLIIDAGGYIGTAAIAFAEAFPNAKVVTLEPSRQNFRVLCRNVARYKNIIPLNAALGNRSDIASLRDRGTGEWGFTVVEDPIDKPDATILQQTAVFCIPDLMARFGATGVDLLKLDIEGSEYELLKDRPSWIDDVDVVAAELHDRIRPGCSEAFYRAVEGRRLTKTVEKVVAHR